VRPSERGYMSETNVPEDLRYTAEHEWVRITGERAIVGISDYAQDQLGDVVFVSLPQVGAEVRAGDAIAEIESTKSVSDIYAPVTGTVRAVNDALADAPELVNQDPYGAGWIYELTVSEPGAFDELLDAAEYRRLAD
jgi:glycine cleavage system H protein